MSFCTWRSDNTDVTGYVADGAASLTLGVHIVTTAYTSPVWHESATLTSTSYVDAQRHFSLRPRHCAALTRPYPAVALHWPFSLPAKCSRAANFLHGDSNNY